MRTDNINNNNNNNNNNNRGILVILLVIGVFHFEVFGGIFVIFEILRGFGHFGSSKGYFSNFPKFNCFLHHFIGFKDILVNFKVLGVFESF